MVRNLLLAAAIMLSHSVCAWANSIDWIRQFGTNVQDGGLGAATDDAGNIYVSGWTDGNLAGTQAGSGDAFVSKYDSTGNRLWIRQFGTNVGDEARSVSVDALGNVYVGGGTLGNLGGTNAGDTDLYVRKYDSGGSLQWTRQFGTDATSEFFGDLSADPLGNLYVVGTTSGNLGGPNAGSAGTLDAFVRKYDSNGAHLWTQQFGTDTSDNALAVTTDNFGNIFVGGGTGGSLDGTSASGSYIRKYDKDGSHQWTSQFNGGTSSELLDVSIDDLGALYVAGTTTGNLGGTNAGGFDAFLQKFDAGGVRQWTRQVGTSSRDHGRAVAADRLGNVYLAGETFGDLNGPSAGLPDVFVTRFSDAGDLQWTQTFGSSQSENIGRGSISADRFGNLFVAGVTGGSLDGANYGATDIFLTAISERVPEPPSYLLLSCIAAGLPFRFRSRGGKSVPN